MYVDDAIFRGKPRVSLAFTDRVSNGERKWLLKCRY